MKFLARRSVFYLVAAWAAITINFFLPRAMPGNAVDALLARYPQLQPQAYQALAVAFGIGHQGSLFHQYVSYLGNLVHGNFGTDLNSYPASVSSLLAAALPWTVILVGSATVISFFLGTALGALAAWRRGGWLDNLLPALMFLEATPYFFLALLIVDAFALHLHAFPAQEGYTLGLVPSWNLTFIQSALYHSLLPAMTLVLASLGGWMLSMRNVMATTLSEDYILAAQAKGLSQRRVLTVYAARNAILPNISAFALSLGFVVSGAIVMEVVFSYPGVGLLLYNSVTSNDYPMLQAIFLLVSLGVLAANFLADLVYVAVDPRSRRAGAR